MSEPAMRSARRARSADTSAAVEDGADSRTYSIRELAEELKLTPRAIRFYEAKGLVSPKRVGASRSYDRRDRARLILVVRGKNLGFSLEDIAEYLTLYDADTRQIAQLKHLVAKVDDAIERLERKRADIERSLHELKDVQARAHAELGRRQGRT